MKIVYCTNSICYIGGMERILIAKANALAAIDGNEVWIIVAENRKTLSMPLDERVHLIDLKINYFIDDWKSKWNVLKGVLLKRWLHCKKLKKALNEIQPDIVISQGRSDKHFLPKLKIKSNPSFIREFHLLTNYRWWSINPNRKRERLMAWLADLYDFKYSIKRYDRFVLLTHEDKERYWKNNEKAVVIPNPLTDVHSSQSKLVNKTVVGVGRLSKQKNFESLIRAWVMVHKAHPDWFLEIWGDGEEKKALQCQIEKLHLQNIVFLKGSTFDIFTQYERSSIYVLSSKYEGFGLSIIEAMSCGVPVVSYQCPCGPKDIITDGKDGFLVTVGDEQQLADRIIYLIEHEEERHQMGRVAFLKSQHYDMDVIIDKWMSLFHQLIDEKKKSCSSA